MRRVGRLAAVCVFLLAASCASGDDSGEAASNPNYVAVDSQEPPNAVDSSSAAVDTSAQAAESAGADPDAAPADDLDQIVESFDAFLSLRAQVITGAIASGELAAVATPQAIEQVEVLRSINDDLIANDSYAALTNLAEWSNVTQVVEIDERYVFTDCTERQFITPGGATVVHFVTNNVTMVDNNGQYFVEDVIELQDGSFSLGPDEFGCVPPSFAERAERTADLAVAEAARLISDPGAALAGDLPAVFSDDARDDLALALESLQRDGLARTADETVELQVLGMDVNRPEFTVVVSVCRTYPQGRTFTTKTGETLTTDLPIGSSHEEWVYVQLEPVPSGTESADAATAVLDRGPNCQRG